MQPPSLFMSSRSQSASRRKYGQVPLSVLFGSSLESQQIRSTVSMSHHQKHNCSAPPTTSMSDVHVHCSPLFPIGILFWFRDEFLFSFYLCVFYDAFMIDVFLKIKIKSSFYGVWTRWKIQSCFCGYWVFLCLHLKSQ